MGFQFIEELMTRDAPLLGAAKNIVAITLAVGVCVILSDFLNFW